MAAKRPDAAAPRADPFAVDNEPDLSSFTVTPARKPSPAAREAIREASDRSNFPSRAPPSDRPPAPSSRRRKKGEETPTPREMMRDQETSSSSRPNGLSAPNATTSPSVTPIGVTLAYLDALLAGGLAPDELAEQIKANVSPALAAKVDDLVRLAPPHKLKAMIEAFLKGLAKAEKREASAEAKRKHDRESMAAKRARGDLPTRATQRH